MAGQQPIEDPAHEGANRRIIRGLADWMAMYKNEVKGLDDTRPLLPQLDLLTNEQIVRGVRSMDPLYKQFTNHELQSEWK